MASKSPPSTPSYPSKDQSRVSSLPNECKIAIIDYLSARDVTNLRLVSPAWKEVCIRGFFNVPRSGGQIIERGVLSIRSYRDDMSRLQDISERPWLARHVKHIQVFAGPYLRTCHAGFFAQCLRMHGVDVESGRMREYCLTDLDIWCNVFIMRESFKSLGNVEALTIAQGHWCPFHDTDRCVEWKELCSRITETPSLRSKRVYNNIFEAISQGLQVPLRSLELDGLPLDLLLEEKFLTRLMNMAGWLQTLKLTTHTDQMLVSTRNEEGWGWSILIDCLLELAEHLKTLEIHLPGHHISPMDLKFLYKYSWPHLRSLRITDLPADQEKVYEFLSRHKKTLKYLSINSCIGGHASYPHTTFNGSARAMLTKLRDEFKFEKFEIIFDTQEKIYDKNWIPLSSHRVLDENWSARGIDAPETARLLEGYVRGECEWPMVNDRPPPIGKWFRMPKWQYRIPGFSESASPCVDEIDMMIPARAV